MLKNAFTVDVEDYFHVTAFAQNVSREDWQNLPSRVEYNTQAVMDLLDEHGVHGTFFVLGWVAERYPSLVRDIQRRGHEIASHGYSHQLIYKQSPELFREETLRSKSLLEDLIGSGVKGYRAASYSITERSLWALDILAELGFEYDSSVFPVRHDNYGMPDAPLEIHSISTSKGDLVEFPLSVLPLGRFNLPIAGGGYFRLFPYRFSAYAYRRINDSGLPMIFYIHPWEIDPDQPRIKTSLKSRFRHYNNLNRCKARLDHLLRDFRFTTVADILRDRLPHLAEKI